MFTGYGDEEVFPNDTTWAQDIQSGINAATQLVVSGKQLEAAVKGQPKTSAQVVASNNYFGLSPMIFWSIVGLVGLGGAYLIFRKS